jgi:hypothetical protein
MNKKSNIWRKKRIQATTNVGEDVGIKEPLYTVGGNVI